MRTLNNLIRLAGLLGRMGSWILRLMGHTVMFLITGFVTFWGRVPEVSQTLAKEWKGRAVKAGFDTRYEVQLYYAMLIVAYATIILAWFVLSFMTVGFVRLLF